MCCYTTVSISGEQARLLWLQLLEVFLLGRGEELEQLLRRWKRIAQEAVAPLGKGVAWRPIFSKKYYFTCGGKHETVNYIQV